MTKHFTNQYKYCLCGERFREKNHYMEHKRACKFNAEKSFETLRMYIHALEYSAQSWKKNFENDLVK